MEKIIKAAIDRGASDLHIKAGDVFRARIDGKLVAITKQALTPDQTRTIALRLIPNEHVRQNIDALLDYDCSWGAAGIGRFRVNILRQRSSFMIVMRVIPFNIPTVAELTLPPVLENIALAERGMVLVTGVTGSGKSSTLAAMIHHINLHVHKHIVTLEQPIEFLHRDVQSSITQREVGVDTESYRNGLRSALRQDPDVIVLGELRDAESIDTACKAAETGHLLMATVHTPDAQSTIMRMVSMFPPEEQDVVRIRLAESLHSVISQRLLPRADGRGRIVAAEVMVATPTIRELILDGKRIGEIREFIEDGRDQYRTQSFDQHLADLVSSGTVTFEVAVAASTRPADFELKMKVLNQTGPTGRKSGSASQATNAANGAATNATEESAEWPYANSLESSGQ
ncbi:MAG: type IV pilus twitching motility protein PilT [Gemmatimonadaceae bacterium]